MPVRNLARLIISYRWLVAERDGFARKRPQAPVAHIDAQIDDLFLRIARFPSSDPDICCAQIDFLVTSLAEDEHDADARELLKVAVLEHVQRLAGHPAAGSVAPLVPLLES